MINVKKDVRERCKLDIIFLKETLEKELELKLIGLVSAPLDKVQSNQGYAQALADIIELLHRA